MCRKRDRALGRHADAVTLGQNETIASRLAVDDMEPGASPRQQLVDKVTPRIEYARANNGVVEDAQRVGAESLAELEALTAADAGDSGGAAIVLIGDSGLAELLQDPQLARLAQRVRQRHTIEPLCAAPI